MVNVTEILWKNKNTYSDGLVKWARVKSCCRDRKWNHSTLMATEEGHWFNVALLRRKIPSYDATISRASKQHLTRDSHGTNQTRRPLKTQSHPCLCVPCLVPIKVTLNIRSPIYSTKWRCVFTRIQEIRISPQRTLESQWIPMGHELSCSQPCLPSWWHRHTIAETLRTKRIQ